MTLSPEESIRVEHVLRFIMHEAETQALTNISRNAYRQIDPQTQPTDPMESAFLGVFLIGICWGRSSSNTSAEFVRLLQRSSVDPIANPNTVAEEFEIQLTNQVAHIISLMSH